ncbi:complement receptor type 2-like isoform X2 [Haemaphysalis longicornis]
MCLERRAVFLGGGSAAHYDAFVTPKQRVLCSPALRMADITGASASRIFTCLLPVFIVISASPPKGPFPGDKPCKAPPPRLVNGGYNVSSKGRLATYHCDDHFRLKGPWQLVCIPSPYANGIWMPYSTVPQEKYPDKPECHRACDDFEVEHGRLSGERSGGTFFAPGDRAFVECDPGFGVNGTDQLLCQDDGSWNEQPPTCIALESKSAVLSCQRCSQPEITAQGAHWMKPLRACQEPKIDRGGYHGKCCAPEDEVQFYCNGDRYALFGVKNATCLPDGTWSALLPVCKAEGACDDFEVEHGRLIGKRSGGAFFAPGDSAFVECDPGFRVNGTDELFCEDDGSWDLQPPTCMAQGACDDFEVEHGRLSGERLGGALFAPGDSAFVECDPGFRVNGTDQLFCADDGSWDQQPPTCIAHGACDDFEVEQGRLSGERSGGAFFAPGDRAFVDCDPGFGVNGTDQVLCQEDGSWDLQPPTCMALRACMEPKIDRGGYHGKCCAPEDEVQFYCKGDRYALFGVKNATCLPDGTWSAPLPVCKAEGACDNFEVEHGRVTGKHSSEDFFSPGDSAFVECDPGFGVNGTDQLLCQDDGSWDQQPPTCIEYNCTRFNLDPCRIVDEFEGTNDTVFAEGTSINFRCKTGYLLQGAFSTTCQNGRWFGRLPKCEKIRCGTLRSPPNGWIGEFNSTAVGSKARFYCSQGYALLGSQERECQDYGEWSGSPVRCVPLAMHTAQRRTSCLDPGTPDNGFRVGGSHFGIGSQVEFSCNAGYHLRGNAAIRCLMNGVWSARPPLCIGKYYFDDQRNVEEALRSILREDIRPPALQEDYSNYVYFLLDASTSIGERNFRRGINLAKAITRKVTISEDGNRIGAIVFATNASVEINMLDCNSTDDALQKLDNIRYLDGRGTSIKAGVEAVVTNLHAVTNHLQAAQNNVKVSVFLITHGKANIGGRAGNVAKLLKGKKIEVYCIAITGSADAKALEELASYPVEKHLFLLRNYDALQWLADRLNNDIIDYSVCGISNEHRRDTGLEGEGKPRPRILGGERVVRSWPWMVEISRKELDLVSCGGTIIGRKWILTAAHCMYLKMESRPLRPADIHVWARAIRKNGTNGTNDLEGAPIELDVEQIILHENYNSSLSEFWNDIALLRLKKNITYERHVRPICLPPAKGQSTFYRAGESAVVIGWGAQKSGERQYFVKHLEQIVKVIGTEADCWTSPHGKNYRPQGMMCANSESGDSCQGSSGGPLMQGVEGDEIVWTQVGIVSWGGGCKKEKFGFYTDVSYYVPWIQRHMDADAAAEAAVRGNSGYNAVVDHAVFCPYI